MKKVLLILILSIFLVQIGGCASRDSAPKPKKSGSKADVAFFEGKTITFIVTTKPGGGYDTYGRLVARYLQKHLPGSTVIVKNVAGAGHIIGTNEIYNAEPDGLTIGLTNHGLLFQQLVGAEGIKFDLANMTWLVRLVAEPRVMVVGTKTPYKTIDDVVNASKPVKIGTDAVGASDYADAHMLQKGLGLNLAVIPGYGGKENELAVMRGEIDGLVGSWSSVRPFVESGEGRVILQVSARKAAGLEQIPIAKDLAKQEYKSLVDLMTAVTELGRPIVGPPGIPPQRAEALLEALRSSLTDPELLAEAEKMGLPLDPLYGADLVEMVRSALKQPPEIVALLKEIFASK